MEPSDSSTIRAHLFEQYVLPAERRGDYTVTIHVGTVVREMNPMPHIPAVCGVLGSNRFTEEARLKRLAIDGPVPGSDTLFVFKFSRFARR